MLVKHQPTGWLRVGLSKGRPKHPGQLSFWRPPEAGRPARQVDLSHSPGPAALVTSAQTVLGTLPGDPQPQPVATCSVNCCTSPNFVSCCKITSNILASLELLRIKRQCSLSALSVFLGAFHYAVLLIMFVLEKPTDD